MNTRRIAASSTTEAPSAGVTIAIGVEDVRLEPVDVGVTGGMREEPIALIRAAVR